MKTAKQRKDAKFSGKGSPRDRAPLPDTTPRWDARCEVCGGSPVVGDLGMCGPCTFGEADTAGGEW